MFVVFSSSRSDNLELQASVDRLPTASVRVATSFIHLSTSARLIARDFWQACRMSRESQILYHTFQNFHMRHWLFPFLGFFISYRRLTAVWFFGIELVLWAHKVRTSISMFSPTMIPPPSRSYQPASQLSNQVSIGQPTCSFFLPPPA